MPQPAKPTPTSTPTEIRVLVIAIPHRGRPELRSVRPASIARYWSAAKDPETGERLDDEGLSALQSWWPFAKAYQYWGPRCAEVRRLLCTLYPPSPAAAKLAAELTQLLEEPHGAGYMEVVCAKLGSSADRILQEVQVQLFVTTAVDQQLSHWIDQELDQRVEGIESHPHATGVDAGSVSTPVPCQRQ